MDNLNPRRVALALGSFVALWHLVWLVFVALGWAKPILDLILSLHHVEVPIMIDPFSIGKAVGLLIITFIVGYIFGWVFATGWNMCRKH